MQSNLENKSFPCRWVGCKKSFAHAQSCKRHEALHLTDRHFTCEGCHKTFPRLDALKKHHKSEVGADCREAGGTDENGNPIPGMTEASSPEIALEEGGSGRNGKGRGKPGSPRRRNGKGGGGDGVPA
ncbi:hypothetical protein DL93DRAFT_1161211 [Clavulina sp. PMI_390]|nr:hypothetical protein DL93DRAFT_1161211 [Clavulina sp. PMI_390]